MHNKPNQISNRNNLGRTSFRRELSITALGHTKKQGLGAAVGPQLPTLSCNFLAHLSVS